MFWPFNIPAKRREREAQQRREELKRIKDDIEAKNRRQRRRESLISPSPAISRPFTANPTASAATSSRASSNAYDARLSPVNPLSPLNPINQFSTWSVPDEPRHTSSHCDTSSGSSSHSSSDYSSNHSSHDHSCSSSSYDSGSSSSSSD